MADDVGAASGDMLGQRDSVSAPSNPPAHEHEAPASSAARAPEAAAPTPSSGENAREGVAEMTVNVKFIHHESVSLLCAPSILVAELRRRVMEVEHARAIDGDDDGSESPRLRLIYKGKVLKDDQALSAYNFQHEDTIHAVFGRPPTASEAPTPASPPPSQEQTNVRGEARNTGDGVVMGRLIIDSDPESPALGNLIESMFASAMLGAAAPSTSSVSSAPAHASFAPGNVPASTAPTSASYTGVASSAAPRTSYPLASASATTSAPYVSSAATSSASSAAPAAAMRGVSPARAHFLAQQASTTQARNSGAAAVQDQVAAVRRMMPPIDLGSMSRPSALSEEMYVLGNVVREASDTFMALHRQLAYLSGRLLNENNLNALERARLRMRMQQLGPVLRGAGGLATSLDQLLADSSLGWPTRTPPTTTNSNPPPAPRSGPSAASPRPGPSQEASGGSGAAGGSASFDSLQRGSGGSQPTRSEPADAAPALGASPSAQSLIQLARDQLEAAQSRSSTSDNRQNGSSANPVLPGFESRGPPPSVMDYLQRLSEGAQASTSGMGALGSILAETGNFLTQNQATTRPLMPMQPRQTPSSRRGTVPSVTSSWASLARPRSSLGSFPAISTTPIADLVDAVLNRCVGTLDNDISEFYHHCSEYMRRMLPASEPESIVRERRKEWRVRAMNEIETKTAYCCDEELVCRDDLLSPTMDAALDTFIRECLDASFLRSGVPADSPNSPIHNAWIKIWSNVRWWVNQQPSATGNLLLSRILVEEVRGVADDLQGLCRKLYDRTMECAALIPEQPPARA